MTAVWAGIDAGKTHHHCVAIDESGRRLLSRRIADDEPELLGDVLALGDDVTWGIDLADGGAALAIAILINHGQPVRHISGRTIHHASEGYRGEGKTDAKDAAVIAGQARIRRDLHPVRAGDEIVTDLKIPTNRRTDLGVDRMCTANPAPFPAHQHLPQPGKGPGPRQHRPTRLADGTAGKDGAGRTASPPSPGPVHPPLRPPCCGASAPAPAGRRSATV